MKLAEEAEVLLLKALPDLLGWISVDEGPLVVFWFARHLKKLEQGKCPFLCFDAL